MAAPVTPELQADKQVSAHQGALRAQIGGGELHVVSLLTRIGGEAARLRLRISDVESLQPYNPGGYEASIWRWAPAPGSVSCLD